MAPTAAPPPITRAAVAAGTSQRSPGRESQTLIEGTSSPYDFPVAAILRGRR
jgi:hypothetical protein